MLLRLKILIALAALLVSTLACSAFLGEAPAEPVATNLPATEPPAVIITEAPATEIPFTETPAPISCSVLTDKMIAASLTESNSQGETLDEEMYLVTYTVDGEDISDPLYEDADANLQDLQDDEAAHQQAWDYFTAIIPAEQRGVIGEYAVFTDGVDGTLAAVTQTQDDPNIWSLEVDTADSKDTYSLTFTLIHEFGHLLTLGPNQVPPSLAVFNNPEDDNLYLKEVSACPQYFPGEGCANADSYINAYYDQFWTEIHDEWNAINLEEDEDIYYEKLDDFYYKYETQFVDDYAATNPEEDMAETWAFFVLGPKPAGDTIAEEKILFFYQYPELLQLREQILNNVCVSFPQ